MGIAKPLPKKATHVPWRKILVIQKKTYPPLAKKTRKHNKHIRIRNKKLCKKYPWLTPKNVWSGIVSWYDFKYDSTLLDEIPDGWRKAFGNIWCEEIDQAARKDKVINELSIFQLKEKYGQFRQYFNTSSSTLNHITNAFEVISEHVCIFCGKLDAHVINDYGWYLPLCEKCYTTHDKWGKTSYAERLEEAGTSPDEMIPLSYTMRSYTPKTDTITTKTYDISDIVQKIRHKNRKRFKNEQKAS